MSKNARRKKKQAVRLFELTVKSITKTLKTYSAPQPHTGTSVATFERYAKRLAELSEDSDGDCQFWILFEKAFLKLLKYVTKLRD
jgi:hypothetical protein